MDDNLSKKNTTAQFLIFTTESGTPKIEVRVEGEMVWLTQKLMAELFDVSIPTINEHLKNIFETAELQEDSVIRKFRITAADGKGYDAMHYNLDAVIAVGYRVNSKQATHFRMWATQVLREFIIKGFVLDDERLKQGRKLFDTDYFKELLERVRSIRASERRIYQQIVAKNYLKEDEIKQLERTVTGFFDYVEGLIARNNTFTMKQFAKSVDKFLTFNEYKILDGKGSVSRSDAEDKAVAEYKEFNKNQKVVSDFDREVKKIIGNNKTEPI